MQWFLDGDQVVVTYDDFVDLQTSPAVFVPVEHVLGKRITYSGLESLMDHDRRRLEERLEERVKEKGMKLNKDRREKLWEIFWSAILEWFIPAVLAYIFYDLMGKNDVAFVVALVMFAFGQWLFGNMLADPKPGDKFLHY